MPITIELVYNSKGQLVGRTVSDRWNLEALGVNTPIAQDRNNSAVKRLRRANPDFKFRVCHWTAKPATQPTPAEHNALGAVARLFYDWVGNIARIA